MANGSPYAKITVMRSFRQNSRGFTVVEVLVVLAVAMTLFTTTVFMVSGQIARYRFRTSAETASQMIADTMNDVQVGYFEPITDKTTGELPDCGGGVGVGESDCIFAGKKITITPDGVIARTNVWMKDKKTAPTGVGDLKEDLTSVETALPGSIDYKNELTYYILFNNYDDSLASGFGGAQSYGVYYDGGPSGFVKRVAGEESVAKLCMHDGSRTARVVVGIGGAMTSTLQYDQPECLP